MKKIFGVLSGFIIILFSIWFYHHNFTFSRYSELSKLKAQECIKMTMQDTIPGDLQFLTLVKDEKTAIAIAEPILFNLYGKKQILMERPYKICLVNNDWVIFGTFPRIEGFLGFNGGTFEMILNSKNAEVKSITHGK